MRSCASIAMTEPQPVMAMAHSTVWVPTLAPPSTATTLSPCACRRPLDQVEGELDVDGVGGGGFQQLMTDAAPRAGIRLVHAIVETIGDHRAVIGCVQHESKLASDVAHEPPGRGDGAARTNHMP